MIIIRLAKGGSKNKPFYRVVAADKQKKVSGKFIEVLGYFNPIKKDFKIDMDLYKKWTALGAEVSQKVKGLVEKK